MIENGFHDIPPGKVSVIVTHLEMRAPAELRAVPLMDGVTFRKVTPDLDWYRDIFTRVGSLEWLWYGRMVMPSDELRAIVDDPKMEFYTLSRDGQDEALLELDFRTTGECELAYFGVTPTLIGTGAGRYLMNEAITRAWSRPISRLHVHTCTIDSPQALSFYIRSGFAPYRQQIEIADDPRVSGILPRTAGPNVPIFEA